MTLNVIENVENNPMVRDAVFPDATNLDKPKQLTDSDPLYGYRTKQQEIKNPKQQARNEFNYALSGRHKFKY